MDSAVRVINASQSNQIYVRLRPVQDATIPYPPDSSIMPYGSDSLSAPDATMNMFVWIDPQKQPVWTGIVPTKVQKDIIIHPDQKKVTYDNIEIPSGFEPVTTLPPVPPKEKSTSIAFYIILILGILLILAGVWYYFNR